ncbi:MAG: hypothetical protein FJ298_07130 [Planctomycetes bacterium]|nr:hypothetical protein [Planctomycetota bacterium]
MREVSLPVPSSFSAAILLCSTALPVHGQGSWPLELGGVQGTTGGLVWTVDHARVDELADLGQVGAMWVPLPDGSTVELALERMRIERHGFAFHVDGAPALGLLDGLSLSLWKGVVRGVAGSDVHVAFSHLGAQGWIDTGAQLVHLIARPAPGGDWWNSDVLMTSEASLTALTGGSASTSGFGACSMLRPPRASVAPVQTGNAAPAFLGSGSCTLRECKLAIESDVQYYQRFNNVAAQASYTATLWAFISDRYETQAATILTFPYVGFYTSGSDPWSTPDTGGDAGAMLGEFQAAWIGQLPAGARLGHFMSGANLGGGVAWLGVLCDSTYNFAVSGNLNAAVPFPVQLHPANWDFMVCAHELGHNFSAPHTHDYCPPVDECSPVGYFGACQTQQVCTNQGTLMSYCHLCSGGLGNVNPSFHPRSAQDMSAAALACLPEYQAISATPPNVLAPFQPTSQSVAISGTPLGQVRAFWRASPGMPWQLVNFAAQGGGTWTGSLPGFSCSDTPQWYYEFDEASCGTVRFPASAPATPLAAVVGSHVNAFADSFETDQGWIPVNVGATSGLWQRGVPVNDPNWTYAPQADGDGSGSCWLTGNVLGASDVDVGSVLLLSPPLDLRGNDVSLDYYFFLRLSIANGIDMLKLEVSPAGGLGPWVEIARHTSSAAAWRTHSIPVASIAALGVPISANMRVRFTANDSGAPSTVEAGLDGFRVGHVECNGPLGLSYCISIGNSSGAPARIFGDGSTSIAANDLVLTAAPVPSSTYGLFLYGSSPSFSNFGSGVKCVGNPTRRLPVVSGNGSSLRHVVDSSAGSASGVLVPGTTWYFQAWFRDNGFGNAATMLSDGLRLTFVP